MADGVRVATTGSALYVRLDGPFAYGEFTLQSVAYDVGHALQAAIPLP